MPNTKWKAGLKLPRGGDPRRRERGKRKKPGQAKSPAGKTPSPAHTPEEMGAESRGAVKQRRRVVSTEKNHARRNTSGRSKPVAGKKGGSRDSGRQRTENASPHSKEAPGRSSDQRQVGKAIDNRKGGATEKEGHSVESRGQRRRPHLQQGIEKPASNDGEKNESRKRKASAKSP